MAIQPCGKFLIVAQGLSEFSFNLAEFSGARHSIVLVPEADAGRAATELYECGAYHLPRLRTYKAL